MDWICGVKEVLGRRMRIGEKLTLYYGGRRRDRDCKLV